MKNLAALRLGSCLIPVSVAATAIFLSGCATPDEHSFNTDYGQFLVTAPKYYIEDESDDHFKIVVHQGKPSEGAERVLDVKSAATDIAKSEALRLGWERWQLNYIQEKDQGWMHVVVAKVRREPYAEPAVPQSNSTQ